LEQAVDLLTAVLVVGEKSVKRALETVLYKQVRNLAAYRSRKKKQRLLQQLLGGSL